MVLERRLKLRLLSFVCAGDRSGKHVTTGSVERMDCRHVRLRGKFREIWKGTPARVVPYFLICLGIVSPRASPTYSSIPSKDNSFQFPLL